MEHGGEISPVPATPGDAAHTRIGVDDWVAEAEERQRGRGPLVRTVAAIPRPIQIVVFIAVLSLLPFVFSEGNLFRYGLFTLIYALLALGLNVSVGFAGLLDLGFIAFFGCGAYMYAILASPQSGNPWQAEAAIPVVVVFTALVGLLIGLPSRRLFGDYLAIMTLFFGQAFVVFVNNANRISFPFVGHADLTGGSNGIANIDSFNFFGYVFYSTKQQYYFLLVAVALVLILLAFINDSRTGRAWRALREDPLAAEAMSIPVNRLKLLAFVFGAATAGFTGAIYGTIATAALPGDYDVGLLITIYAIMILGGFGSMMGIVVGAVIVSSVPELLRSSVNARPLFYGAILLAILVKLRPWRRLAAELAGLVAFGFALHAIASAAYPRLVDGNAIGSGAFARGLTHWMLIPRAVVKIPDVAYIALVAAIVIYPQLSRLWQAILLPPLLYLVMFVWENLLLVHIGGATRLILLGALLVALMNVRPQGLFGSAYVEIA